MKKTLLFFIISLIGIIAHAQTSMTDDQIKTYVIEEYQNGTSEQEIVTQLLKRGATIQQIKKVRTDLEKQRKALSQNEKNNAKSNDVRLRTPHVPNDNSKKDNKKIQKRLLDTK